MTAVADNKQRVTISTAKPGDRFDVQVLNDGKVMLTPLTPKEQIVPEVEGILTEQGFVMFPPGRRPTREAVLGFLRRDRDEYQ